MPKGVYQHKPQQGFQKGHKTNLGKHWKLCVVYKRTKYHKKRIKEGLNGKCWNKGKKCPWIGENNKKRECSETTKEKSRKSHSREKSYRWKGGITPLKKQIRQCFKYRQWRSDIFTKNNFTCVECMAKSGNGKTVYLEAHHYPKRFSETMEEYQIKTLEQALECEEFWNINNGITLCKECHKKHLKIINK